jgi:hypothetical protein
MSEIQGMVKNLKTIQTDSGPKSAFSIVLAEGRDVPAVSPANEHLYAGERIIASGEYDTDGTLIVQALRQFVDVPKPVIPPAETGKLRPARMILSGLLGDLAGFVPTLCLIALFHIKFSISQKMSIPVLFLYTASSVGCALLLGLIFAGKRRTTNLYIAGISALILPIVFLIK